MRKLIQNLWGNIKNIPGLKLKDKILVIESDDYGSIFIKNEKHLNELIQNKFVSSDQASKYDALENTDDLSSLFNVLKKHNDRKGNRACYTPFVNIANPDTEFILGSNFSKYGYINFNETLERYDKYPKEIIELYEEGSSQGYFTPQSHGREHVNISALMKCVQHGELYSELIQKSISSDFYHPKLPLNISKYKNFRPAFYFDNIQEKEYLKNIIDDSINLFNSTFSKEATVFCPQNGVFHDDFKQVLADRNVKGIVESGVRSVPNSQGGVNQRRKFVFGLKDITGLATYSRNVTFEPCKYGTIPSISTAITSIERAFRWSKPAVIATHRSNYSGRVSIENREQGLSALDMLLSQVKKKWPDVIFMSSDQLVKLINKIER